MKKLYICLFAISLALAGCSSDDNKNTVIKSSIKFTINGEKKILNNVKIFPSIVYPNGNEDYLSAFAVNESGNIAIRITFPKDKNYAPLGDGSIEYLESPNEFYGWDVDVNYIENSRNVVKGTFSGTFNNAMSPPDEQTRVITNGTFEITR